MVPIVSSDGCHWGPLEISLGSDVLTEAIFGNLAGIRAVITGSSSGIGRATALEFARGGADIVLHCRHSVESAETLADEIREIGRSVRLCTADLAIEEQLEPFVTRAWDCFDGVDVWVNNAGVDLLTGEESQLEYGAKLNRLFEVDVRATMLLSRMVAERMSQAAGGSILNIGWDQADRGMAGESGELFAASKNAVMGATRSLAASFAPRVRINCIAPGWIRTSWGETAGEYWQERVKSETPLKRWGKPEDVAATARFLSSPDANYITGQVVNVNGGAVR